LANLKVIKPVIRKIEEIGHELFSLQNFDKNLLIKEKVVTIEESSKISECILKASESLNMILKIIKNNLEVK